MTYLSNIVGKICIASVDLQASLISCSLLLDVISFIETHPSRRLLFPSKTMYKLNADKQPAILPKTLDLLRHDTSYISVLCS